MCRPVMIWQLKSNVALWYTVGSWQHQLWSRTYLATATIDLVAIECNASFAVVAGSDAAFAAAVFFVVCVAPAVVAAARSPDVFLAFF